ncbi:MAG: phosphoribosylamine--glycine ligase [Chthonomonadales bacterium]|nr:phosphoribosylamine--glycine ligase [Chthonomonadales bacterium]
MRVLVVGGGGREHALVWKLAQSRHVDRIYCAPGNAGIARLAECINLQATDISGLANFASAENIDLTVIGPEASLIAGIVDRFEARGLRAFGPSTDPARIEGSKGFAKELMVRYGIPTAPYRICGDAESAHDAVRRHYAAHPEPGFRIVIKADGLAAGKGVTVATSEEEAHETIEAMMVRRVFGEAGDRVLIEECLDGHEVSVMAITDGETVVPLAPAKDHKRVRDGDQGPNTGGMGAYSPVPTLPDTIVRDALELVLKPAISAIRDLGIPYKGVLYAGLMVTSEGIKALEFNCRFGDPETQVVLPLMEADLFEVMDAAVNGRLDEIDLAVSDQAAVCVVATAGGYPGEYETGLEIQGLDRAAQLESCTVFHAGTRECDGRICTAGGRVLGVTAVGKDLSAASSAAYMAIDQIQFAGMHYRRDIGG